MSEVDNVDAWDLILYTRSFATMLGAGVSLQRTLDILGQISDEPLKSATVEMRSRIREEGRSLSAEMRKRHELFTQMYVAMVRAGEVGGVLDETFAQLADLLESDWAYCEETGQGCRSLLLPSCREPAEPSAESAPAARLRMLSQYFRSLAMMLTAGVPLAEGPANALNTAAEIFPPGPEREALAAIPETMEGRAPATALPRSFDLPFIPSWTVQLISVGVETPTLHIMCEKIAQLLEYQRQCSLLKHGQG
jgi:type II secretory pathway component PulF